MKNILCILLVVSSIACFGQQNADYDRILERFRVHFNKLEVDSAYDMLSVRVRAMIAAEKFSESLKSVYAKYGELQSLNFKERNDILMSYRAKYEKGLLELMVAFDSTGKFTTLRFLPATPKKDSVDPSDYRLDTKTGKIYGTLSMPEITKPVPVVLWIAGSGPTDRDGNSAMGYRTDAYKMMADSLRQHGIACLRFDKRGVGESANAMWNQAKFTLDDYVSDAVDFIDQLSKDKRFSKIILAGHSEGSLIGILAAQKTSVGAFISIAGAGERADWVMLNQMQEQNPSIVPKAEKMFDSLLRGYELKSIDPDLKMYFNVSIQAYMRSWFRYDPAKEIAKLKIPVLILQGSTDIQVHVSDAENLAKASPNAKEEVIMGMNHILKNAPYDRQANMATYNNPALPLSAELVKDIVLFVNQ